MAAASDSAVLAADLAARLAVAEAEAEGLAVRLAGAEARAVHAGGMRRTLEAGQVQMGLELKEYQVGWRGVGRAWWEGGGAAGECQVVCVCVGGRRRTPEVGLDVQER